MDINKLTKINDGIKTIRFKAEPVLCTRDNLTKKGVLEYDLILQDKVKALAEGMDKMFCSLLNNAITNINCITLEAIETVANGSENDHQNLVNDVAKQLSQSIHFSFNAKAITDTFVKWVKTSDLANKDELLEIVKTKEIYTIMTKYMKSREYILLGTKRNSAAIRLVDNAVIWYQNLKEVQSLSDDQLAAINQYLGDIATAMENVTDYMTQLGIEDYNMLISGCTDGKIYIKGYNQVANEWNQQQSRHEKHYIRLLKKMNKMILSEQTPQFVISRFENEEELYESLVSFQKETTYYISRAISMLANLTNNVYLCCTAVDNISNEVFGKRMFLRNLIKEDIREKTNKKPEEVSKITKKDIYSVEYINSLLFKANETITVQNFYADKMNKIHQVFYARESALIGNVFGKGYLNLETDVNYMKDYLDTLVALNRELRLFELNTNGKIVDSEFYYELPAILECFSHCNKMYNMVRNFVTKKPADLINEFMSCLGDGAKFNSNWVQSDITKLKSNEQAMLRRNGEYFYLAFAKGVKSFLTTSSEPTENSYEKLYIKKLSKGIMQLPRWMYMTKGERADEIFADSTIMDYMRTKNMIHPITITREMWKNKESGKWSASYVDKKVLSKLSSKEADHRRKEHRESLNQLIDAYKLFIANYSETQYYNYHFKATEEYQTIKEFADDFETQSYASKIIYINADELESLIKKGDAYLFRLTNHAIRTGRFNDSFALYLRALWEENSTIKINSAPSMRYRDAAIKYTVTHKEGSILVGRTTTKGEHIPPGIYQELYLYKNNKTSSLSTEASMYLPFLRCKRAKYDMIKDKRYTQESFTFSFSITYNADVIHNDRAGVKLNRIIKEELIAEGGSNIVSVVRGEKNLLYMTVIDKEGNVLLSKSLNKVCGIDYQQKLKSMDIDRKTQSWKSTMQVATVKNGYLSFAITEILATVKKYNAVIAIESINERFKDRRSCIDNQVYKRFETMLISRMNCYFTLDASEEGSFHNPYQLASEKNNYIQNGLLFNIDTSYTANICPKSGFVNVFDYSKITSVKKEKDFLSNLDKIVYNGEEFEFYFSYENYVCKKESDIKQWCVNTTVSSYQYKKEKHGYVETSPKQLMLDVCENEKISFMNGENILPFLLESKSDASIDAVYTAFQICTKMQYITVENNKIEDCYKSPVVFTKKPVFLPSNKDEAKAYNIALKCQLNINHIINGESVGIKSGEWFSFKQKRDN